jgi:hypothetical protein
LKLITSVLLLGVFVSFTICPAYSQTGFDQTFRWNFFSTFGEGTHLESQPFRINVDFKTVRIQYLEVHAVATNNGPGGFSFVLAGHLNTFCLSSAISPLPEVYASTSYIDQNENIGWVQEGWSADVSFWVDFLATNFGVNPPGTPSGGGSINYYDNILDLSQGMCGNSFLATIYLTGSAASNARIFVSTASIRVKGISYGIPVPEFGATGVTLVLGLVSALSILGLSKSIRRRH